MSNSTYNSLKERHIYRFRGLLLEAAYCDVWTLNLLTERGEYIPVEHGVLIAYELRADGSWDSVHHSSYQAGKCGRFPTEIQWK